MIASAPAAREEPGEFEHLTQLIGATGIRGVVPRPSRVAWAGDGISGIRWGLPPYPVLLLHGGGVNAHAWDATVGALGDAAVAVDLPGHGQSVWIPDANFEPTALAERLVPVVLDVADGQPLIVCGHSLGGLVAIAIATLVPDAVRALVLVDVTPEPSSVDAASIASFIGAGLTFRSRDEIVARAREFGVVGDDEALAHGIRLNTEAVAGGGYRFRHQLAHLGPEDAGIRWDPEETWRRLERLDLPVTLVRGDRGFVSPASEARFLSVGKHRWSVTVASGHNVPSRAPRAVAEAIAAALEAMPPR